MGPSLRQSLDPIPLGHGDWWTSQGQWKGTEPPGKRLSFPVGLECAGTAAVVPEPQAGVFEERVSVQEPRASELHYTYAAEHCSAIKRKNICLRRQHGWTRRALCEVK